MQVPGHRVFVVNAGAFAFFVPFARGSVANVASAEAFGRVSFINRGHHCTDFEDDGARFVLVDVFPFAVGIVASVSSTWFGAKALELLLLNMSSRTRPKRQSSSDPRGVDVIMLIGME